MDSRALGSGLFFPLALAFDADSEASPPATGSPRARLSSLRRQQAGGSERPGRTSQLGWAELQAQQRPPVGPGEGSPP